MAARGPKPGGALRQRGVRIDYSAADPFTTHELLDELGGLKLQGERVIVQRYGSLNRELDAALAARGAEVTEIPTYRWSLPQDTAPLEQLVARLERGEMHAVVFTNAEQARNLFAVSAKLNKEEVLKKALNKVLVASIGPVASAALREAGVKVGLEASPPKMGALLSALDKALVMKWAFIVLACVAGNAAKPDLSEPRRPPGGGLRARRRGRLRRAHPGRAARPRARPAARDRQPPRRRLEHRRRARGEERARRLHAADRQPVEHPGQPADQPAERASTRSRTWCR